MCKHIMPFLYKEIYMQKKEKKKTFKYDIAAVLYYNVSNMSKVMRFTS